MHSPFAPVVQLPEVAPGPVTVNRTRMPGVGLPKTSREVAVTVCSVATWFLAAAGESTSVAGGPGTHVLEAVPVGSGRGGVASRTPSPSVSANAVIASVPGVVGPM